MAASLAGKVAIVTGAGMGLGRSIALRLARGGAIPVLADVNKDASLETAELIKAQGEGEARSLVHETDVTSDASIGELFKATQGSFGKVDIVVNNAGVAELGHFVRNETFELTAKEIAIDLTSVIQITREAARNMPNGGSVVNVASMGGLTVMPYSPIYAACKAGVINFSRSCQGLQSEFGVKVTAICPSFVDTPLVNDLGKDFRDLIASLGVPELLRPDDIAKGVEQLLVDESIKTGAIMRVNLYKGKVIYDFDYSARGPDGRPMKDLNKRE